MKQLILFILLLSTPVFAGQTPVTITFSDSTMIEDAHVYSFAPTFNYGRANSGSANRVVTTVGTNYSDDWKMFFRILAVKDSIDAHSGFVIDSAKLVLTVQSTAVGAGKSFYLVASGIDTNMNWGEGNNAAAAANCEVCWDSAQTIGTGACATAQAWNTAGAAGTADTSGYFTGLPSDSFLINEATSVGDLVSLWIDTSIINSWAAANANNEGFLVEYSTKSASMQAYLSFYSSECNTLTNITDSIPIFYLYGHTTTAGRMHYGSANYGGS